MKNFEFDDLSRLLSRSGSFAVTSHHNPDGDAIGSILALTLLLNKMGKNAIPIVPNEYPDFLKWLPGSDLVKVYETEPDTTEIALQEADVIFCLDYNALHRTAGMQNALRRAKAKKILIDHHLEPSLQDFDLYHTTVETSSTSELVYRLIVGCGWLEWLDKDSASALYVGIMTDTGSFSYACDLPETFEVTASLVRLGIDPGNIHRLVYDTYSENRLRLLGYCLSEKLTVLPEFRAAYIALSEEEMQRFQYRVGDTEGVVNYALSIEGINLAVLLTERSDRIRLSFRSKGDFSVNKLAKEHFQGGGHKNAAGGDSYVSLTETIAKLRDVLVQYKDLLNRSTPK